MMADGFHNFVVGRTSLNLFATMRAVQTDRPDNVREIIEKLKTMAIKRGNAAALFFTRQVPCCNLPEPGLTDNDPSPTLALSASLKKTWLPASLPGACLGLPYRAGT